MNLHTYYTAIKWNKRTIDRPATPYANIVYLLGYHDFISF